MWNKSSLLQNEGIVNLTEERVEDLHEIGRSFLKELKTNTVLKVSSDGPLLKYR